MLVVKSRKGKLQQWPRKNNSKCWKMRPFPTALQGWKKKGFQPVRRIEKPVFREVIKNGKKEYEPVARKILFEGRKSEH